MANHTASPDRTREMRRLYDDEQMTLRDIGARFGISTERVRQLLRKDGYTPRPRGFQPGEPPEPFEYEVEVTRTQVKRVTVLALSKAAAKEQALERVNWDDGLPMKTTIKVSYHVDEVEE